MIIAKNLKYEIYIGNKLVLSPGEKNYGITSAKLNLAINEPGTLTLSMKNYGVKMLKGELKPYTTLVGVKIKDEWIFAGRIISTSKDIYGNVEIEAEGGIAALNDVCVPYKEGYYETIVSFLRSVTDNYTFIMGIYDPIQGNSDELIISPAVNGIDFILESSANDGDKFEMVLKKVDQDGNPIENDDDISMDYVKPLETFSSKVLNRKTAFLHTKYTYNIWDTTVPDSVNNPLNLEATIKVQIEYISEIHGGIGYDNIEGCPSFITGQNILDLSEEPSKWSPYSGIMPVGKDGLTIGKYEKYIFDDVVWDSSLEEIYGKIVKVVEFPEVEYSDDLLNLAAEYILMYSRNPGTKFTVNAIEPCLIFDNVTEVSKIGHAGVVNGHVSPFLSINFDFLNLQNCEYILGPLVPEGIINEDVTHLNRRS